MSFRERTITQKLTPEFLERVAGFQNDEEAFEEIVELADRFEQTYNATVQVSREKQRIGDRQPVNYQYVIDVVPARSADRDEMKRATQSFFHWLGND